MRISGWSSDVCSSDLVLYQPALGQLALHRREAEPAARRGGGAFVLVGTEETDEQLGKFARFLLAILGVIGAVDLRELRGGGERLGQAAALVNEAELARGPAAPDAPFGPAQSRLRRTDAPLGRQGGSP